jgi:hypothetical protein
MHYNKEKEILLTIISSFFITGFYALYVYYEYVAGNPEIINSMKFWGIAFLVLIPISIIAQIIIHIIFVIINKILTNEDVPNISDERDKLIDLKAIRISHWIFTLGFLLAMASQAFEMPPYIMFITLFIFGFIASMTSEIVKIFMYRRGF